MQENAGSVENTAAETSEETTQVSGEAKSKKTKKTKSKKTKSKEVKIPTVNAILEKEEAVDIADTDGNVPEESSVEDSTVARENDVTSSEHEADETGASPAEPESAEAEVAPAESEAAETDAAPAEPESAETEASETDASPAETEAAPSESEVTEISESSEPEPEVEAVTSETASELTPTADSQQAAESPKIDEPEDEIEDDDSEEKEDINSKREALDLDGETALIETVLFLESESQTVESLAKITQFSIDVVNECIVRLKEKYSASDSGIEITKVLGGWMLVPKRESFDFVKERYGKKNEGRLSRAAIETLSIIAYSQPITRPEIQSIRHVNVDNMMRILLERNFIKEVGKKDVPGKPVMYGTTKEFLEFFHLQSIADLPQLEEKENERFVDLAR